MYIHTHAHKTVNPKTDQMVHNSVRMDSQSNIWREKKCEHNPAPN